MDGWMETVRGCLPHCFLSLISHPNHVHLVKLPAQPLPPSCVHRLGGEERFNHQSLLRCISNPSTAHRPLLSFQLVRSFPAPPAGPAPPISPTPAHDATARSSGGGGRPATLALQQQQQPSVSAVLQQGRGDGPAAGIAAAAAAAGGGGEPAPQWVGTQLQGGSPQLDVSLRSMGGGAEGNTSVRSPPADRTLADTTAPAHHLTTLHIPTAAHSPSSRAAADCRGGHGHVSDHAFAAASHRTGRDAVAAAAAQGGSDRPSVAARATAAASATSTATIISFKKLEIDLGALDFITDQKFLEAVYTFVATLPMPDVWQDAGWQADMQRMQVGVGVGVCGGGCLSVLGCVCRGEGLFSCGWGTIACECAVYSCLDMCVAAFKIQEALRWDILRACFTA